MRENVNLTHVFVKPLKMCVQAIFGRTSMRECNSVVPAGLICIYNKRNGME